MVPISRFGKKKSVSAKVATLSKQVRIIKKSIETKHIDVTAAVGAASAGSFTLLNGLSQGDDVVNRSGNLAYFKNIGIRFAYSIADTTNYIRTILVWDNQPNSATPTTLDFLQAPSDPILSPIKWDNRKRFKILRDDVAVLDTDDPLSKSASVKKRYVHIGKKSFYSGAGGTIATLGTGALWLFVASDSNVAPNPTCTFYARLTFADG